MDGELRWWFTLGIPLLSVMDFQRRHYLHWGIPRSSMTVSLWDDPTLGHSHFKGCFYWRYSHSTHWWLIFEITISWDVTLSLVMDVDCSLGHSHFSWFILGHSRHGEYFSWEHSHLIGSFTLGHIHFLEGDLFGPLHWSAWRVIWRSLDYFMLSSWHTEA